jgi:hypothetical protein
VETEIFSDYRTFLKKRRLHVSLFSTSENGCTVLHTAPGAFSEGARHHFGCALY